MTVHCGAAFSQAQRAEGMLLALPEDLALKPALSRFYRRAEPVVS